MYIKRPLGHIHRASGNPFLDRLIEKTTQSSRTRIHKQSRSHPSNEMTFFTGTSAFLNPGASRKKTPRYPEETEQYDELERSFASNVSLNSPPREPIALAASDCEPMDISPAPARVQSKHRQRAFTGGSRLFGNDLSNSNATLLPSPRVADTLSKPAAATQSSNKRIQRSALPAEWLTVARQPAPPSPNPMREPSSPMDDAMDVDSSYMAERAPEPASPIESSSAPAEKGFNKLFYDDFSPSAAPVSSRRSFESPAPPENKKRRSLSPESVRAHKLDLESSPMLPSSPSDAKLERMGKPSLQGLGAPSATTKRIRRPVLSAVVQTYGNGAQSAYPTLSPARNDGSMSDDGSPRGAVPVRRAFSAFLPPSIYTEPEEDESSFEHDMSSPAQAYSKRQQVKTIRRCDGTEDFRPMTGATALVMKESPSAKFMAAGLPGFGDNEAHGKILPCHRVTEDGLMRISASTLDSLLDGQFNDQITDYHIIDCRFDYEYIGGHIPGAVNINTTAAVEELLLGPSLTKPKPSVSGDQNRKTVLVFHCEFSAKRAPTFAKHLRAKDRALNNHVYPKIHYPEVYILEGGYCQYFKTSGSRCQPPAYVTMDDPHHASSRREDLDQFRKAKFGRHKSYAYGDGASKTLAYGAQAAQQPKRNTAPSGPTSLFAAATAARSRRNTNSLTTLVEDGNVTGDNDDNDTDTDLGDSPCPPPVKSATFKGGKKTIRSMVRSETYSSARFNY